jgi:hypothetical protein
MTVYQIQISGCEASIPEQKKLYLFTLYHENLISFGDSAWYFTFKKVEVGSGKVFASLPG